MKTSIKTFYQTKSPFSVITLEFDQLPVEEAKAIIDAMNFGPGPLNRDIKRTSFNCSVKEKAVIVTIFYEHTQDGQYYHAIRTQDPVTDSGNILEALKAALSIFEKETVAS